MLVEIPNHIAVPSHSPSWDGKVKQLVDEDMLSKLIEWRDYIRKEYYATKGQMQVNSSYREKGTDPVDATDANGHWSGRAIDYSADRTIKSFWPRCNVKHNLWMRDLVRRTLWEVGFYFPWLWKNGSLYEFWHFSIEKIKWKQYNAYRGNPSIRDIPNNYIEKLASWGRGKNKPFPEEKKC